MKTIVSSELERDGYALYLEPWEPPLKRMNWSPYRPDVFGLSLKEEKEKKIVISECETKPNISKVCNKTFKIRRWLSYQKKLCEEHNLCFLLVILAGNHKKVNTPSITRLWDIWIMNNKGTVLYKIPKRILS